MGVKKSAFDRMRIQNLTTVFRTVVEQGPISRADISGITGLNKMTVTNAVRTLIDADLMVEKEAAATPVGRPPILTDLNAAYGVIVGIELNIISCKVVTVEFNGNIIDQQIVTGIAPDPEMFLEYVENLAKEMQTDSRYLHGLLGIGIALPGNYNSETECVEYISNMPAWNGFPIGKCIKDRIPGVSIRILNAARAEADGELDFGRIGDGKDITYIYGAMGLALSMYSQGGMHVGHRGFNGRFGHNIIVADGKQCTCGNRGCLEMYASVHSICEELYPGQTITDEMIADILAREKAEDPAVMSAIRECIHYLAIGIANIINIFNPRRVCIGNYLGMLLSGWEKELNDEVNGYLLPHYREERKVFTSGLKEWGAALGGTVSIRTKVFETIVSDK